MGVFKLTGASASRRPGFSRQLPLDRPCFTDRLHGLRVDQGAEIAWRFAKPRGTNNTTHQLQIARARQVGHKLRTTSRRHRGLRNHRAPTGRAGVTSSSPGSDRGRSSTRCAMPQATAEMFRRPRSSTFMAVLKPWPGTPPMMFAAGMRTFPRMTSQVMVPRCLIFRSFFPSLMPGRSAGMMKAETPDAPGLPVPSIRMPCEPRVKRRAAPCILDRPFSRAKNRSQ